MATLSENQIKHMVSRFLCWKLPETFRPDAGITFKAEFNEHTAHPMKHEPSGTNLFDAVQAEAMVRHMTDGMPPRPECPYCGATQGLRMRCDGGGYSAPEYTCKSCFTGTDDGPSFDDLPEA